MIAVDTNVLVHAHRKDAPFHQDSFSLLKKFAEGREPWAIPFPCIHEFYSVVTNPKIFKIPTAESLAVAQIQGWLNSPSLVMLSEGKLYFNLLAQLIIKYKVKGALVHDARIIALCQQAGIGSIYSFDRDFSRFKEIKRLAI